MGRGIVHPVDVMGNKPWSEDLLDYLGELPRGERLRPQEADGAHRHVAGLSVAGRAAGEGRVGDGYVFRGPELKRLTAEQFIDAIWMLTDTAPDETDRAGGDPAFPAIDVPKERRFVRGDARGLRRPHALAGPAQPRAGGHDAAGATDARLQALDLANGQILTATLDRGAAEILKANPKATPDELAEWVFVRALSRKPTKASARPRRRCWARSRRPRAWRICSGRS